MEGTSFTSQWLACNLFSNGLSSLAYQTEPLPPTTRWVKVGGVHDGPLEHAQKHDTVAGLLYQCESVLILGVSCLYVRNYLHGFNLGAANDRFTR